MEAPLELDLHFLGERRYLQGTTLFDALAPYCRNGTAISFRIPRLIVSDRVRIESFDPGADDTRRFHATLVWNQCSSAKGLGVVPLEQSPAPQRRPFDEAAIVSRAEFATGVVVARDQRGESLVRSIVALNKALLLGLLQPPQPGQWLFTRLDLERCVETYRELRIVHRTSVGFAAVSSTIEIDGRAAGTVMFSWLRK